MADPKDPAEDPPSLPPAEQGADPGPADPGAGGQGGDDTQVSAAGEAPLVPPAAPGDPEGEAPIPGPKKEDWREAKIKRLTAQLHELREKPAASAETPVPGPSPEERLNEAEIERRAREYARQSNAIDTFNRMCKEAADSGRQAFPDWDTRISALRTAFSGGPEDVQQQVTYNQFVAAALETGSAPQILHALGGDLDEAARIMAMPSIKMAVELTRLAGRAPDTSATRAPKPITPVGSKGAAHTAISPDDPERADTLSISDWMKRRDAQVEEGFKSRGRR